MDPGSQYRLWLCVRHQWNWHWCNPHALLLENGTLVWLGNDHLEEEDEMVHKNEVVEEKEDFAIILLRWSENRNDVAPQFAIRNLLKRGYCPNHSKSCPRKMCTMLTKLGRQMMKKVAILLCIVLEFFQSGGRFWCGGVFGYYEIRFCFAFASLCYYCCRCCVRRQSFF